MAYNSELRKLSVALDKSIQQRVIRRMDELADAGPAAMRAAVRVAVDESGAVLSDQEIQRLTDAQWERVQEASDETVILMFAEAAMMDRDDIERLAESEPKDPDNPTREEQIGAALGTALDADGRRSRTAWMRENRDLVRDIPKKHEQDLTSKLLGDLAAGAAAEVMRRTARDQGGITRRRTQTIAEDQSQKGVGALQRDRLTSAGLGQYRWRTVGDDRVREAHREREGKVFSWSQEPAGGHPGEDFNCRCVAEPVLTLR